MKQSRPSKYRYVAPALAAAIAIGGVTGQVLAQGSSSVGQGGSSAEVDRGVPGVDLNLPKALGGKGAGATVSNQDDQKTDSQQAASNQDTSQPGSDTSTMGAGPDTSSSQGSSGSSGRAPIQDRN